MTLFATRLRAVESMVPDDIAEYGISSTDLDAILRRLLTWGQGLTRHSPEPTVSPDA